MKTGFLDKKTGRQDFLDWKTGFLDRKTGRQVIREWDKHRRLWRLAIATHPQKKLGRTNS